jgi:hypothetical protein
MITPRPRRGSLLLAMLAFTVAACDDDDPSGPTPVARLRFVHAAQGTNTVDFRVDNNDAKPDVGYASNSLTFSNVTPGTRALAARANNGNTDLATLNQALPNGSAFTAVLVKRQAGVAMVAFPDTQPTPAANKAWVRILNVAPAAGNVDVYVTEANADLATATPQVTAVEFERASKYIEVDAASRRVRLTTAGTKTVVLDVQQLALPSQGVRTIVVLDANNGGTPLQSITGQDKN